MTEPAEDPLPVAYCAPGHLLAAELALDEAGEQVAEIKEHPYLVGQDGVLLVKREPEPEPTVPVSIFEVTWPDIEHCRICNGYPPWHGLSCPIYWLIHPLPTTGPLIAGLPGL